MDPENSDNNPAAFDKEAETEDLIAELCLKAPSDSVKFCLRNYQYGKPLNQIEKDFEKEKKGVLLETAEFLKICNFESKTKKPLAQLIICRIQNLLPENCTICSERYRISINEEPLLDCAICGQGVHKSCWTTLATAMANDINDLTDLNAKSFKDLFNPLKLPGLYYICDMCKVTTIPNEESGNSKRKKLKDSTTQPELGDGNSSQGSNNSETEQTAVLHPVVAQQEADDPSTSDGEDEQKSVTQPLSNSQLVMQNDVSNEKTSTVCRFFTNGNCKHGMRGKECKYTHPKVCSKFTQHGTR